MPPVDASVNVAMSRYQSNSSSRRRAQDDLPLPWPFISISELLKDSQGEGKIVSVIGVVKDFQSPIATSGPGKNYVFYSQYMGHIY